MWDIYESDGWVLEVYDEAMYGARLRNTRTGDEYITFSYIIYVRYEDFEVAMGPTFDSLVVNTSGFISWFARISDYEDEIGKEINRRMKNIERILGEEQPVVAELIETYTGLDFIVHAYNMLYVIEHKGNTYYRCACGHLRGSSYVDWRLHDVNASSISVKCDDKLYYFYICRDIEAATICIQESARKNNIARRADISIINKYIERLQDILESLNPAVLR
jgi:hypothetical protein